MPKIRTESSRAQFVIDILFGAILLTPLVYGLVISNKPMLVMAFTAGASSAYFLHVTQKVIIFNDVLKSQVKEEAQREVKQQAQETVQEEAEETVQEKVEQEVEAKVEEVK